MEQRVNTLAEKMAAVEERMRSLEEKQDRAHDEREALSVKQEEINKSLQQLLLKISKWEGKFGGVLFIVGCLWAFFSGFGKAIVAWVQAFGGVGK